MQEALVVRRETHIPAPPAAVFALLTDPEKILRWMGTEAQVEPQPGARNSRTAGLPSALSALMTTSSNGRPSTAPCSRTEMAVACGLALLLSRAALQSTRGASG